MSLVERMAPDAKRRWGVKAEIWYSGTPGEGYSAAVVAGGQVVLQAHGKRRRAVQLLLADALEGVAEMADHRRRKAMV